MEKEIYIKVLNQLNDVFFLSRNPIITQKRDFVIIGDEMIKMLLDEIPSIDEAEVKKIICIRENYSQEKYLALDDSALRVLICKEIIGLRTYPADELELIEQKYNDIKNAYDEFINTIDSELTTIDSYIMVDDTCPENCGSLVKRQRRIRSANNGNKSLLKDLKKIENEYFELFDTIQEKYVFKEMLKYAKKSVESIFKDTIFMETDMGNVFMKLQKKAIELSLEDNSDIKAYKSNFMEYANCLEAWSNAVQSIYKPFFLVKMRKAIDEIEEFYISNINSTYYSREEELINICKSKRDDIMDSDKWIKLKTEDKEQYLETLISHINKYDVLKYIRSKSRNMYCLKSREDMLNSIATAFENGDYVAFMNLVVVQIEGLFYDLFIDANIQNRLDGQLDLFEKDDLRTKLDKNASGMGLEEATLYFKFYFNNLIRNKVAHGRYVALGEKQEELACELLLDLQYVIYLLERYSDTNEASNFVRNTVKWLEFSFSETVNNERIFERLLNLLNNNVITHKRYDDIDYMDSHQNLYWIFNPYYDEVYEYEGIIDLRNKIRAYLIGKDFWEYVLEYVQSYDQHEYKHMKLNKEFLSRVKAIQMYVAKNSRESLVLVSETRKALEELNL